MKSAFTFIIRFWIWGKEKIIVYYYHKYLYTVLEDCLYRMMKTQQQQQQQLQQPHYFNNQASIQYNTIISVYLSICLRIRIRDISLSLFN